jgi:hypothetical protein
MDTAIATAAGTAFSPTPDRVDAPVAGATTDPGGARLSPGPHRLAPQCLWAELIVRERRLAVYGALLLALLVPMALAWGVDERTLRGVNVWIKPMKFALSIAVLAWTTAWFIGHLAEPRRRGRSVDLIVWMLVGCGTFELGYIGLQAALGQASHYNADSLLHIVLYSLMGLGALGLTVTQPMLAWQLHRHGDNRRPEPYRLAVCSGLVLTFILGAGAGMLLSARQPPDAAAGLTVPLFGWSLVGADLRPAHFIGIHAEQVLPVAGAIVAALGLRRGRSWVWAVTIGYGGLFAAAFWWGLGGHGA